MIEQVKKIKLEELNKQKSQCEEKEKAIKQRLNEIQDRLWHLKGEQATGITIKYKFSFLDKLFTQRKQYKEFKAKVKRLSKLPKLIEEAEYELYKENERVKDELETSGIRTELEEIKQQMSFIEEAETLRSLGMTPMEAIVFLENNGIEPILSEADKVVIG